MTEEKKKDSLYKKVMDIHRGKMYKKTEEKKGTLEPQFVLTQGTKTLAKSLTSGSNPGSNGILAGKSDKTLVVSPISVGSTQNTNGSVSDNNITYKLQINSDGMIGISPSIGVIANVLCKIPGSIYLTKTKEWLFQPEHYNTVIQLLVSNKLNYTKIPKGVLALCGYKKTSVEFDLSGGIYDRLLAFQRSAVEFGLNNNGKVLLADDMGCGKTIQALAIAKYYELEWPMLVIAPASLLHSWKESIETFLEAGSTVIKERGDFGDKILIVSYQLATKHIDVLSRREFKVIICDECHYLKNNTSKRTKALLPILENTPRLIMCSGTPATSRPVELFPVINALRPGLFSSFTEYGFRYCNGKKVGTWFDFKGSSNADELMWLLEKTIMIRRTKEQVLRELPSKTRRQVVMDIDKDVQLENTNGLLVTGKLVGEDVMAAYRTASALKQNNVIKYVEEMVKNDKKFLVFAHHQTLLDAVEEFLKNNLTKYIRIDGTVSSIKRHNMVEKFQTDPSYKVAVLSMTAASTGLTLTAAKTVVFAELYWNPGLLLQAEDRIHRIGQTEPVDIHYIVCKKTVDEIVWPYLIKKLNVLEKIGISENSLKKVKEIDEKQKTLDKFITKR